MDQIQVQIVELQIGKRFCKGVERLLVAAFVVPDFAGDEQGRPFDAGFTDAPADTDFVSVDRGRINVTVSLLDCHLDRRYGRLTVRCLPRPESNARNGVSIAENKAV